MEENAKKFNFGEFLKKSWFYIVMVLIVGLALAVMLSDRDVKISGDVEYEQPVYYITGNNLYVKERGKDEILISTTLFQDLESRTNQDALSAALMSPDGEYLYFYENILIEDEVLTGDFCVFHNGRKKVIEEDTSIYFAVSDSYDKVAFLSLKKGVTGGTGYEDLQYDLYTFDVKKGRELVQTAVMPAWYTMSGDGNTVAYIKNYDAATDSYSLFTKSKGIEKFIDDHMYFYGDFVPNGTAKANWPRLNFDASRILYSTRMKFNEMTDMYLYSNGQSNLIGEDVLQVFCDAELTTALLLHDYQNEIFVGTMTRINLETLEKEKIADEVWGMASVNVAVTLEKELLDLNIYFKNYNDIINVADLCMMTPDGEKILINSTEVTGPVISKDGKMVYGLDYWVEEDGGQLVKIYLNPDNTFERLEYDEFVKEFIASASGNYVTYKIDEDLFMIGTDDKKVFVDRYDIESYGILTGDELLYFFRSSGLGNGNAFVREIGKSADVKMISEATHFVWDFYDGNIAFLTGYDFAEKTGALYITDGFGSYELIAEKVELPLFYNKIP
ncbi:MAG: hypothetical protein JXN10_03690 [Clostridia bacterium]|nr:hypothetical protein [Clostridia bacterium]MBN2882605.1 hypothetical protein [Clostridia bacterium]